VFEVLGLKFQHSQLEESQRKTWSFVKAITRQSLLALDYLHDTCVIIHCGKLVFDQLARLNCMDADIKPGNILLQMSMGSLSSVAAALSTTNSLNTAGQPISQSLCPMISKLRLPTWGTVGIPESVRMLLI
jgi:hypothetical protein